eukprot:scaffold43368_cov214-Amphora_coffeaeformis.AAC.1
MQGAVALDVLIGGTPTRAIVGSSSYHGLSDNSNVNIIIIIFFIISKKETFFALPKCSKQ